MKPFAIVAFAIFALKLLVRLSRLIAGRYPINESTTRSDDGVGVFITLALIIWGILVIWR